MSVTALIAGTGTLPALLAGRLEAEGKPFVLAELEGFPVTAKPDWERIPFRVETLAKLFGALRKRGVSRVVFAGAIARPRIDPKKIDLKTALLLPKLLPRFKQGDDALLRAVIELFEGAGFQVVGAADIVPELLPDAGVLGQVQPTEADRADAARAAEITATLGALDIGQGCVVAQGLCLAVETLPGTDAMLQWVADVAAARRPKPDGAKGVFYKALKPGQEVRVDMPVIGLETLRAAARGGLAGIVIAKGGVMVLNRAEMVAEADRLGLFIWVREP